MSLPVLRPQLGIIIVVLAAVAGACSQQPNPDLARPSPTERTEASSDPWAGLRRPLEPIQPGTCEPARGRLISAEFGPAFGEGPAYPVLGGNDVASMNVSPDIRKDGVWWLKTLWVAAPTFHGRVLVRGAPNAVAPLRFRARSSDWLPELQIEWKDSGGPAGSASWKQQGSFTLVTEPGCYQWQVDTAAGTTIIRFEVRLTI
jgi:hypothetical protein